MSKTKETHLWFEKGDDEIQVESYSKKLNEAILELNKKVPGSVYIIDDEETLQVSKFECEYRATRREEMTKLLLDHGCSKVEWKFPDETEFYQPIVVARKA